MALMNCSGNYLEFELRHDNDDDPPGLTKHNREQRKRSIKELVNRVDELTLINDKEQFKLPKISQSQKQEYSAQKQKMLPK